MNKPKVGQIWRRDYDQKEVMIVSCTPYHWHNNVLNGWEIHFGGSQDAIYVGTAYNRPWPLAEYTLVKE